MIDITVLDTPSDMRLDSAVLWNMLGELQYQLVSPEKPLEMQMLSFKHLSYHLMCVYSNSSLKRTSFGSGWMKRFLVKGLPK